MNELNDIQNNITLWIDTGNNRAGIVKSNFQNVRNKEKTQ